MSDNITAEKQKWYDVEEYKYHVEYERYEHRVDKDQYMFKDTGFKMNDEDVLIAQYSMRRHLSDADIEVLKKNAPPKPKFRVLTKAQYDKKMSCNQKKYRRRVDNYYLEREAFFSNDQKGWAFQYKAENLDEQDKVQKAKQDKLKAYYEDQEVRNKDFEKRLAKQKNDAVNLGEEFNEQERKDEIEQNSTAFKQSYRELEDELKAENITVDKKASEKLIVDRRKTRKMEGLPMLTDNEVLEKFAEIKRDAPNYYRLVSDGISDIIKNYNISEAVEIRLEKYRWMLDKKQDLAKEKEMDRMIAERMEARKNKPVEFNKKLVGVFQMAPQKYKNSCWARSGANLINTVQMNIDADGLREVDDDYFIKEEEPEYNEEARKNAYKDLGDVDDLGMIDNYMDTKAEINLFRKDPDRNVGNLYLMADYFLKSTLTLSSANTSRNTLFTRSNASSLVISSPFF